jgi:VWFA-related protein
MTLSRRSFVLGTATALWAQDAKFSTDVNVVTLFATVRDADGHIAKDLTRDDFVLLENGEPQTIRYFSRESDVPLTVGLLVDTSRSQIDVLEPERRASYTFLDQMLRPDKDKAFIAQFNNRVELLQGFTSSRDELRAALDKLHIPLIFATLLFAAVKETSESMMRSERGRKAFILLSDGGSFRDKTIETSIEYAQRADTIIYSIFYGGVVSKVRTSVLIALSPVGGTLGAALHAKGVKRGKSNMRRMAQETGGAYFEISQSNTIENAYAQIEDALRNQYSLGYTSKRAGQSGEYRKIELTVKKPGLIVQTRDGYYATTPY